MLIPGGFVRALFRDKERALTPEEAKLFRIHLASKKGKPTGFYAL
jgi:hypothetical protein